MIRYALRCKKGHEFEGWFKGSADYERQEKRGLVSCPSCGSNKVERAVMAPAVATKGAVAPVQVARTAGPQDAKRAEIQAEMMTLMRKLRTEVEKNADYVGPQFAEEARKIHYEEAPARGIYGEASPDDVKSLKEEGIEFYPLPVLPEDQN